MAHLRPFSQVDGSTTRRHGGTGLGHAISKQLAEAIGDTIDFNSKLGSGSTFRLDVPFRPPLSADVEAGVTAAVLPSGGTRGSTRHRPVRASR